eukprot:SAG11_NODE_29889_length_306_cov_0.743961_1_plen_54_part_10
MYMIAMENDTDDEEQKRLWRTATGTSTGYDMNKKVLQALPISWGRYKILHLIHL